MLLFAAYTFDQMDSPSCKSETRMDDGQGRESKIEWESPPPSKYIITVSKQIEGFFRV